MEEQEYTPRQRIVLKYIDKMAKFLKQLDPRPSRTEVRECFKIVREYLEHPSVHSVPKGFIFAITNYVLLPKLSQKAIAEKYKVSRNTLTATRRKVVEVCGLPEKQYYNPGYKFKFTILDETTEPPTTQWKKERKKQYLAWDKGEHCEKCGLLQDRCDCERLSQLFDWWDKNDTEAEEEKA